MKKIVYLIIGLILLTNFAYSADSNASTKVETLFKTDKSWDGTKLPNYPVGDPELTMLKIEIAPGATLPVHEHPVINAGLMLSGELTVETEKGEILHLKAGDTIVEVVNKWHYGKNEGDKPAVIVVFYVGTKDSAITVIKE